MLAAIRKPQGFSTGHSAPVPIQRCQEMTPKNTVKAIMLTALILVSLAMSSEADDSGADSAVPGRDLSASPVETVVLAPATR